MLVKEVNYDSIKPISSATNTFNELDQLIQTDYYDSLFRLYTRHKFIYDNTSNKVDWRYYNSDGSLNSIYYFKYKDGLCIEETVEMPTGIVFIAKTLNQYDEHDNKIEISQFDPSEKCMSIRRYKHDEHDNITSSEEIDGQGAVVDTRTFQYTYDLKDNWIKKISFENGVPKTLTLRNIKYFEP